MKKRESGKKKHRALSWCRKNWMLTAILALTIVSMALSSGFLPVLSVYPENTGIQTLAYDRDHAADMMIEELVYPTIGNPAIVKKGATFIVEFDPRSGDHSKRMPAMANFRVSIASSNDSCPYSTELPILTFFEDTSWHWPTRMESETQRAVRSIVTDMLVPGPFKPYQLTGMLKPNRICILEVEVPYDVPEGLYDMTVTGVDTDGGTYSDAQRHSFKAVNDFKKNFVFAQLTDVHIYGPEAEFANYIPNERSGRESAEIDDREWQKQHKGATYFQKTIDQLNIIKPEFVIITGDLMLGTVYFNKEQGHPWGWTTECAYEMLWFYEELLRLQVPVYLVPGNHDSYNEGATEEQALQGAGEDYFDNWQAVFGPTYYSFNYGDYHFLAMNVQDWTKEERTLIDYNFTMQPEKDKGQFKGGGDPWKDSVTNERIANVDPSDFNSQLAWARRDLQRYQGSKMRFMAMHQDPWMVDGRGDMWSSGVKGIGFVNQMMYVMGGAGKYGDGEGRLAVLRLAREHDVSMIMSGHFHSDTVSMDTRPATDSSGQPLNLLRWGEAKKNPAYNPNQPLKSALDNLRSGRSVDEFIWVNEPGQDTKQGVVMVNTTSTMFPTRGLAGNYPGYRLIFVSEDRVESLAYQPNAKKQVTIDGRKVPMPWWSYPVYANTTIGGQTNLDKLTIPAVELIVDPSRVRTHHADNDPKKPFTRIAFKVINHLQTPLKNAFYQVPMEYPAESGKFYEVSGAKRFYAYDNMKKAPDTRYYQIYFDVPAATGDKAGETEISISKSKGPDDVAPTVSVTINDGAPATDSRRVKLTIDASEIGGPGVGEMMVSENPDFPDTVWRQYKRRISFELSADAGQKTVYVKLRDLAIPPNESDVVSATILYQPH